MYFMLKACGSPQGGGDQSHVDACGHMGGGVKTLIFLWIAGRHAGSIKDVTSQEISVIIPI